MESLFVEFDYLVLPEMRIIGNFGKLKEVGHRTDLVKLISKLDAVQSRTVGHDEILRFYDYGANVCTGAIERDSFDSELGIHG